MVGASMAACGNTQPQRVHICVAGAKQCLLSAIRRTITKLFRGLRYKVVVFVGWQAAFLFGNATVRENILFGEPFDEARYNEAIDAAALLPDLMQMPGDPFSSPRVWYEVGSYRRRATKRGLSCQAVIRMPCSRYLALA